MTTLLIHGGLPGEADAELFWHRPGIVSALRHKGFEVLAPNRLERPRDWTAEADHLAMSLPDHPVIVIAGSNGCSAAARLALTVPDAVERLILAWPATAGDPSVDAHTLRTVPDLAPLLAGETLRGVTDAELATITAPAAVLPSIPDNPTHQRRTADALLHLLPQATELPGCPEPPQPAFQLAPFLNAVIAWLSSPASERAGTGTPHPPV